VQIHEFLKFLSKKAAATVRKKRLPLPRRYSHSGSSSGSSSGSAAMDISNINYSFDLI
jgi:hypothetical protein